MGSKYDNISDDLTSLLDELSRRKIPLNHDRMLACIEDPRDLVAHREAGVAFENLCQNLFEWDFALTNQDYIRIKQIGRRFAFPESTWNFLNKLLGSNDQP
jgi:hypothetical protein